MIDPAKRFRDAGASEQLACVLAKMEQELIERFGAGYEELRNRLEEHMDIDERKAREGLRRGAVQKACEHAARHGHATLIVAGRGAFAEVAEMAQGLGHICRRDNVTGEIILTDYYNHPKVRLFPYTELSKSPKYLCGCRDVFVEPAVAATMPEEMVTGIRPFLAVNNKHLHTEQKRASAKPEAERAAWLKTYRQAAVALLGRRPTPVNQPAETMQLSRIVELARMVADGCLMENSDE
jgi:hypothetical protein